MYKGKKILGVIPARGGSKRVREKNIRPLAAKPLIGYTIDAALETPSIDRLIVSTDDKKIAEVARSYKAEVPFIRPAALAEDTTPDQPVFVHALNWLKEHEGYQPDILVNLRATTPFKTAKIIEEVIKKIIDSEANVVRTMTKVTGVHHPYWMYTLSKDGKATLFDDSIDLSQFYQSQLLPPVFRINGVVDAYRVQLILKGDILRDKNIIGLVIDEKYSIDIDTERDIKFSESLILPGTMPTKGDAEHEDN